MAAYILKAVSQKQLDMYSHISIKVVQMFLQGVNVKGRNPKRKEKKKIKPYYNLAQFKRKNKQIE
jgi:hypothetical protein